MAYYYPEPSHTFSEYLLIPGYTSEECIPDRVSLRTPLVKYRKGVEEPAFPFPACALHTCPHSSVYLRYRNFNLLSIGYVFRPGLRPRLTQSRSALLWKP